jgi:hypothetical protein
MFAFARIRAAIAMRVEDHYSNGASWWVRLNGKGGNLHEMPPHLDGYIAAAGARTRGHIPLFRTARGGTTGR